MLLEITDGSVSRGGRTVLSHFDFAVRGTEKAGIVGRNGAGKTTLLQLLEGSLELDSNEKNPASGMRTARRLTVGMLHQNALPDQNQTVREAIGCVCRGSSDSLLTGFGFRKEDMDRPVFSFSGGEQEKLAMIRLLLEEPDLLLLDEPTNHLDLETTQWLESWLRSYRKAVLIVSHDRWFLDQTAEVIWEIRDGRLTRYSGNYTRYRQEKQARILRQKKAWEKQQEEIRHLQELVTRFRNRPNKAAFARSRKKLLERMVPVEKPEEDTVRIRTGELLPLRRSSKWVFEAEDLQIGYPGGFARTLDLRIRRGQKIALLGPNGSGKTTLLRTLAGRQAPLEGRLSVGAHADVAWFDQRSAELEDSRDVLTWFREKFPLLTEQEARNTLAGYLFTGKDACRPVSQLSGGEKARLSLAALLEERPNVLLLDEPTNHMDLAARETIESVLQAYKGTLLVISHDRYFLRQVAESLLLFDADEIRYYPFGYEQYVRWKQEQEETGGTAEALRAARTLKEQAMLESFHAVPRKSHLPRELSTEALARDWRLRELEREIQAAAEEWEKAACACQEYREKQLEKELREYRQESRLQESRPQESRPQESRPQESRPRDTLTPQNMRQDGPEIQCTMDHRSKDMAAEADRRMEVAFRRWTDTCLEWYEEWNRESESRR